MGTRQDLIYDAEAFALRAQAAFLPFESDAEGVLITGMWPNTEAAESVQDFKVTWAQLDGRVGDDNPLIDGIRWIESRIVPADILLKT